MIDLSTYGAISSGYAMGMGAARAASSKNAASAISSANAYMDKLGSFNASGGLGQLRADMASAHSAYMSSIGTAGEAAAKKAWLGAQRSYNRGLATQNSLSRQYNALSPQARKHVDKELGGGAGGGVTGTFGGGR